MLERPLLSRIRGRHEVNNKLSTLIDLSELEDDCVRQIETCLSVPFLRRLAIMPDAHTGYGLPIGGVALLEGHVCPEYIGVDIGCGMCFVATDIPSSALSDFRVEVFEGVKRKIPVGFNEREAKLHVNGLPDEPWTRIPDEQKIRSKMLSQFGTLGGGNHFIEIGESVGSGNVCVTIHSGSRNPGLTVANHFIALAKNENVPGFFEIGTESCGQYVSFYTAMAEFARQNREAMMCIVLSVLQDVCTVPVRQVLSVNESHNRLDIRDGDALHRKGATAAEDGRYGVIPGNMRDGVALTKGVGNEKFLCSSSHGAGRRMSRKKAKSSIRIEDFSDQMTGITCDVSERVLDESPDAYKDFETVLSRQHGVNIVVIDRIKPLINVKG